MLQAKFLVLTRRRIIVEQKFRESHSVRFVALRCEAKQHRFSTAWNSLAHFTLSVRAWKVSKSAFSSEMSFIVEENCKGIFYRSHVQIYVHLHFGSCWSSHFCRRSFLLVWKCELREDPTEQTKYVENIAFRDGLRFYPRIFAAIKDTKELNSRTPFREQKTNLPNFSFVSKESRQKSVHFWKTRCCWNMDDKLLETSAAETTQNSWFCALVWSTRLHKRKCVNIHISVLVPPQLFTKLIRFELTWADQPQPFICMGFDCKWDIPICDSLKSLKVHFIRCKQHCTMIKALSFTAQSNHQRVWLSKRNNIVICIHFCFCNFYQTSKPWEPTSFLHTLIKKNTFLIRAEFSKSSITTTQVQTTHTVVCLSQVLKIQWSSQETWAPGILLNSTPSALSAKLFPAQRAGNTKPNKRQGEDPGVKILLGDPRFHSDHSAEDKFNHFSMMRKLW